MSTWEHVSTGLIHTIISPWLNKDEDTWTRCFTERRSAEPPAFMRRDSGVWADWDASGSASSVRGTSRSGGHRGLSLWDQAGPVHPSSRTEDILLWNTVWDSHWRGRMFPVERIPRCVCVVVGGITCLKQQQTKKHEEDVFKRAWSRQ